MPPFAALESTPDVVMLFRATKVMLPPPASISPRLVLIAPFVEVKAIAFPAAVILPVLMF